ncbi:HalOD1 output domain-containing protein [Halosolutus amylolyticus]|uniref:HalOD1 output domain-containing protein n=1 Tax=Halosolutus amylolyticus TaxID=2932267 RepID=A0ABD5PM21_9EURY|nr:HalOD1 output domain-containing protein [Halosolutus amylolyticus]
MIITGTWRGDEQPEPITDAIVTAVADAEGVDVRTLPPLWNVIDPEALEELFAPTNGGRARRRAGRVEFGYCDYDVTVAYGESNTVSIEGRNDRNPR